MAIVYRHIRLDKNQPFYIGIGKNKNRAYSKDSRNVYWKNIVSIADYEVEILFEDLTWQEACDKEIEFIKLYGRKDIGTGILSNMTDGGDGQLGTSSSKKGINNPAYGKPPHNKGKYKYDIELIINLINKNISFEEIQKLTGCSKRTIARYSKINGENKTHKLTGRNKSESHKQSLKEAWIKRKSKKK